MTQTIKQRVSLRELRGDLVDMRDFLRDPLPTDVIAPAPPPVTTSGTALGKARFFLKARHSLTRAVSFFMRVSRWKAMATRVATSDHDRR